MNKRNVLLVLSLPLLVLSACGTDSPSFSESSADVASRENPASSETSTSESSDSRPSTYEVSETEWGTVFSSLAKKCNAALFIYDSMAKIDSSSLFLSKTLFNGDAARVDIGLDSSSSSSESEGSEIETKVAEESYYSREGEKVYRYSPYGEGQYRRTLLSNSEGSPWRTYDSIVSYFPSSFFSFSYDEGSHSYKANELSIEGKDDKVTDATAIFSNGKLTSIICSYGGNYFKFTGIDAIDVVLPSEEKIYVAGKVSKSYWEDVLLKMATELNCRYNVSYSYDDAYNSYRLEKTCDVAGDAMKCSSWYEDHKDTSKSNEEHCYYSKEGDAFYKYSKNGDWYTKASCSDPFKEIEDAILLFADDYDRFTFYDPMGFNFGIYGAASLTIGGKTYEDVYVAFGDKVPEKISYSLDGYHYEVSGFTAMDEIALPNENEVYREGKVTESEWKSALEEADASTNFRLTESSSEDSSESYSESVYRYDGGAIEHTYEAISQSANVSEHAYYSLEGSSYYVYEPKNGFWDKALESEEDPVSSESFSLMKNRIKPFADHFSDFEFDIKTGAYASSSITIDGSVYSDLTIAFKDFSLSKLEYTLNGVSYTLDGFEEQSVSLPGDEDLYQVGKVKKEAWENAFLEASLSPNCSYSYSIAGSDASTDYLISQSGNAIKKTIYVHSYSGGNTETTVVYESKEGDAYYLYSESDSKWAKTKSGEAKEDFDAISSAIALFMDSYDEFSYDERLQGYAVSNSAINGVNYQEARVRFNGQALSEVRWSIDAAHSPLLDNFGNVSITLPTIEE